MTTFVVLVWTPNQHHWYSVNAQTADDAWGKAWIHTRTALQVQFSDGGVVVGPNDVFQVQPDPYHGDWLRRADSLAAAQWRRNVDENREQCVELP